METIEIIYLLLAGMAGQGIRAAIGLADMIILKSEEKLNSIRFFITMVLGSIMGAGISYLFIKDSLTDTGLYLAIFSGLGSTYILENLFKLIKR